MKLIKAGWCLALAAVLLTCRMEAAPLKVVVTTGMVGDLVRQVGGDRVEVVQLMGPGVDPHLYKPTTADASKLSRADLIFYSGLMLEGRMAELFSRMRDGGRRVYAVTDSVPRERIITPEGFGNHYDPHLWFDVGLWSLTVPTIVKGLCEADPEGAADYKRRGAEVEANLAKLDAWCREFSESLPREKRILVTSHDAYNYFGRAYGFTVVGLQGVSTVSEAALSDMTSLIDFIRKQGVKAIFVESSVNPAAIRRVADDAGVRIGGELFSDAMGNPGEIHDGIDTGTYDGMIRHNLTTIVNALK